MAISLGAIPAGGFVRGADAATSPTAAADSLTMASDVAMRGIEVRGILVFDGEPRFCICSPAFPRGQWMNLGETQSELIVKDYFADLDAVEVEYRGRSMVLTLPTVRMRKPVAGDGGSLPLPELSDRQLTLEVLRIRRRMETAKKIEEERTTRERFAAELKRRAGAAKSSGR